MNVDDAARAVGRINMYPHRIVGLGRDFVDEQFRAGYRGDGGRDLRLAAGAPARDL